MEKGWVLVQKFALPFQAEVVKQMLLNNNIESVVLDKHDSSFNSFGEVELYVNETDKALALDLINKSEN